MQEHNSIKWTFLKYYCWEMHKLFSSWKLADGAPEVTAFSHFTSKSSHNSRAGLTNTALVLEPWYTFINQNISVSPIQDFGDLFCLYRLVTIYTQVLWRKVKRTKLGLSSRTNLRRTVGSCSVEYSDQLACWQHEGDPSKLIALMHRLIFPGICTSPSVKYLFLC